MSALGRPERVWSPVPIPGVNPVSQTVPLTNLQDVSKSGEEAFEDADENMQAMDTEIQAAAEKDIPDDLFFF